MPCYFPKQAVYSVRSDGKKVIQFCPINQHHFVEGVDKSSTVPFYKDGKYWPVDGQMSLPCYYCIGCRLDRSIEWALRCVHESKMHENNCFVTLTFDDKHLQEQCVLTPGGYSLSKDHMRLFMYRLRKHFGSGVRVFYCGEYGDRNGRPHYHLCLFNCDFSDKTKVFKIQGNQYYNSDVLSKLWPFGISLFTSFSFETAAYTARYCTKKIYGDKSVEHYAGREPEFACMSLKPGIGKLWLDKFGESDVFPHDSCILDRSSKRVKCKVPRYYEKFWKDVDPDGFALAKERREENAKLRSEDTTFDRLAERLKCQEARMKFLMRKLDGQCDS